MIHLLTSLSNLKLALNESGSEQDILFTQLIDRSSAWIEAYTDRKLRERTYGSGGLEAEYHDGNGSRFLYTRQYPIISVDSLYDDVDNDYGSDTLFDSDDYHIYKDEGKIQLLSDSSLGSVFSVGRSNIKIIYTAGYGTFEIITGRNDSIDFKEQDGGSEITATLDGGIYTADDLCSEIKSAMESVSGVSATYTVTYDRVISKFKITTDQSYLEILWNTGSNARTNCAYLLGFSTSSDDSGATSYESDRSVLGIPDDLEHACILLCMRQYANLDAGKDRFEKESEALNTGAGTGTLRWLNDAIPREAVAILDRYKRWSSALDGI